MQTLEAFYAAYETRSTEIVICDRHFEILMPSSLDPFIDAEDVMHDFPLWSKVWEASLVLADHLARIPPDPERRILEIGCGQGLVGMVASAFGHRVTMTEYNDHALEFARANVQLNRGQGRLLPEIRKMDWHAPDLRGTFDWIVASEVVYREDDFGPLMNLFQTYLAPQGTILLSAGLRRTTMAFLNRMSRSYRIRAKKKILHGKGRESTLVLCTIQPMDAAGSAPL